MCAINCEDCEDKDTCELRPSVTEYNKRIIVKNLCTSVCIRKGYRS